MIDFSLYTFEEGQLNDRSVIWIRFVYDASLKEALKSYLNTVYWNPQRKAWWILDTPATRKLLKLPQKSDVKARLFSKMTSENKKEYLRYVEQLQLKGYSENTVKTYSNEFAQVLMSCKEDPIYEMSSEKLRTYILYCINHLKLSENLIHSRLNAIKFYFEKVLKKSKFFMDIPRPKKPSKLPKVLSQRDIQKLFGVVKNKKHLVILKLCYGMGLRVSEVVNLRISDVDSGRMQVHIQESKNKKDRYVNLPETILEDLRAYYKEYSPKVYLFEGNTPGEQYSLRSVQQVFKQAMKNAKITKKVGVHGLRHSYATHLLEYGTDIGFIQKLLGHNDIKTTLIYTHVAQSQLEAIQSPLDRMNRKD